MTMPSQNAIEDRLQAIEDELAIIRLVASYGPLCDTGRTDIGTALFTADGVYDVSYGRITGPAMFDALLAGDEHQGAVQQGIAHVMGLPFVRVDGDRATAINSTQIYRHDGTEYRIFRIAQNVWHLVRTADGWRISERINRLMGEGDAAPLLLQDALAD